MVNIDIDKNYLNIKLDINRGDFIGIKGKSGVGKTTLLRIISGLEKSNSTIVVDGDIWQDNQIFLKPQKRDIGFLFQDYALFSNMTVMQNLLYIKKDRTLANRLLDMTGISSLKDRYPNMLSGGQKQRVALCRAMMNKPILLLLDEPFSAIDEETKIDIQNELLKIHNEFNMTSIIVSHNKSELDKLCNKIISIEDGRIV